jgi:hypothetical protein
LAAVASGLRVSADILENKTFMQGLSSIVAAYAVTLGSERVASLFKGTADAYGAVLESDVVQRQIVRGSIFAEHLMNDPATRDRGKALLKQIESITNDDDVQEAMVSALTVAKDTLESERLRNISSAAVGYAGAFVESPLVQSTGSGVARVITAATPAVSSLVNSTPVRTVGSITASTAGAVVGSGLARNAAGTAIDTTGAVLSSWPVVNAAKFGWSTTLTVAGGVAKLTNSVRKAAFPGKTSEEMEQDVKVLEKETEARLAQLQEEQVQLAKEEEEARAVARAASARHQENQRVQRDLVAQLNRRKRQLLKRRAEEEGLDFADGEADNQQKPASDATVTETEELHFAVS